MESTDSGTAVEDRCEERESDECHTFENVYQIEQQSLERS